VGQAIKPREDFICSPVSSRQPTMVPWHAWVPWVVGRRWRISTDCA